MVFPATRPNKTSQINSVSCPPNPERGSECYEPSLGTIASETDVFSPLVLLACLVSLMNLVTQVAGVYYVKSRGHYKKQQNSLPTDICLHKNFDRVCFEQHDPRPHPPPPPLVPTDHGAIMSLPWVQGSLLLGELVIWFNWLRSYRVGDRREGTFFTILLFLSSTVLFRILFSLTTLTIGSLTPDRSPSSYQLLVRISLYVDYFCNFFSLSVIFFMSLNRCLCFTARDLNAKMFEGFHVVYPLLTSLLVSAAGAVVCIGSGIQRQFLKHIGFLDVGPSGGLKVLVNRLFYACPIGSIICYTVLYYHLRRQTRVVLARSNQPRAEQKVFVQLLITTILYSLIAVVFEIINLFELSNTSQMSLISILNVFNALPEISLPLLLICSSVQVRKKIAAFVTPKGDKTIVTTPKHTQSGSN